MFNKKQTQSEKITELERQYKLLFQNNSLAISVLTDLVSDLFVVGDTPLEQDRANKAKKILENLGVIEYNDKYPTFKSVEKLLQKVIQI